MSVMDEEMFGRSVRQGGRSVKRRVPLQVDTDPEGLQEEGITS